jgi:AMP nucleosidase
MVVAQIGVGQHIVADGLAFAQAAAVADHQPDIRVLRPDVWLMIGHCGGLRESQAIGDYVLAHAYLREARCTSAMLGMGISGGSTASSTWSSRR